MNDNSHCHACGGHLSIQGVCQQRGKNKRCPKCGVVLGQEGGGYHYPLEMKKQETHGTK